jgi:Fic family protein
VLPFTKIAGQLLAELDGWRERLDSKVLVRSWEGRLRRDLQAASVAASTSIEGIAVTADDVRRIFADDRPTNVTPEDARAVVGYRDAMEFVLKRADDPAFRWDRGLFTNLHDRVMAGSYAEGAGRLRRGETSVVDQSTGLPVFDPPPGADVPHLVDEICEQMNVSTEHPAINAAWVHIAAAAVHPFRDGNGRTARILSSLAMYRGGFKWPEFTSLEEWWGLHRETYYTAFRCLGTKFRARADVSPFVHAHVLAQLDQVRRLDLTERTQRQIWQALEEICSERGMSDRLANALWDAFNGREVTARYYREVNDVSRQTATNDLAAATAAKLLRPVGERRSRRYLAGNELMVAISEVTRVPTASRDEATRPQILGRLAQRLIDEARPRPQQASAGATVESRGKAPSPSHFWDGFGWVESRPETTVMLGKDLASLKQRPRGSRRSRS